MHSTSELKNSSLVVNGTALSNVAWHVPRSGNPDKDNIRRSKDSQKQITNMLFELALVSPLYTIIFLVIFPVQAYNKDNDRA